MSILVVYPLQSTHAATLLNNISETNDKGTFVVRSNIWYAWKFTAGAETTISSVTVNLDETESNYTSFSTYTGTVIKFYADSGGTMGSQIGGQLNYTSTNTGNGHTVYGTGSGGAITLPSAGTYWIGFAPPSSANNYIQMTSSSNVSGEPSWALSFGATSVVSYNSTPNYFSTITYGVPLITIAGSATDSTAPTITSISSDKANGSYTVGEAIDINITFSEAVTATSSVTVTLETGDTDRTCSFTVTASTTATCTYIVEVGDTSADLTVSSISGTIIDTATNTMSNFTPSTNLAANKALVIDTTSPTAQTLSPIDNATGTSRTANMVLTFSEVVTVATGSIALYKTSDGSLVESIPVTGGLVTGSGSSTITINPDTTLDSSTEYYILASSTAFRDTAGNYYAGISSATTWGFTTEDADNPVISSLSPTNGSASVAIAPSLSITFSESVDAESGTVKIYRTSDDSLIETISVGSAQVTGSGSSIISIDLTTTLSNSTTYYATIDATAFDDTSGNSFAGITASSTWTFTTIAAPAGSNNTETRGATGATLQAQMKNMNIPEPIRDLSLVHAALISTIRQRLEQLSAELATMKALPTPPQPRQPTPAPEVPERNLSHGMQGDDVYSLQRTLIDIGTGPAARELKRVGASGYFGTYTKNALGEYQKARKVVPFSGYFGPKTRSLLRSSVIGGY